MTIRFRGRVLHQRHQCELLRSDAASAQGSQRLKPLCRKGMVVLKSECSNVRGHVPIYANAFPLGTWLTYEFDMCSHALRAMVS